MVNVQATKLRVENGAKKKLRGESAKKSGRGKGVEQFERSVGRGEEMQKGKRSEC